MNEFKVAIFSGDILHKVAGYVRSAAASERLVSDCGAGLAHKPPIK
jgi:hypothetical protein